jgi:hypothetical protein
MAPTIEHQFLENDMRVTKAQKEAIRRPGGTLDHLEALAGLPSDECSRLIFWSARSAEVRDSTGVKSPDESLVFERAREVCYKLIEWRISMGELCIILIADGDRNVTECKDRQALSSPRGRRI